MDDLIHASEFKCACGEQAVAFWPMIDPDIQAHPYCQKCLDEARLRLYLELTNESRKRN